MKFKLGPAPVDETFDPEGDGWSSLKEPTPGKLQLIALPIGLVVSTILSGFWYLRGPKVVPLLESLKLWQMILIMLGVMVVHELIHALFFPNWGLDSKTVLGCWPKKLVFYAHYEGPLNKGRFLMVFLAPFMLLSVLPLFYWHASPLLCLISVFNSLSACGDLTAVGLIGYQVPGGYLVRNKGWRTYFTPAA
jgi:hypothetical protein